MRPPLRRPVLQTGRGAKGLPNRQCSRNREGLFAEKEGAGAALFSIPPQQPDEAALDRSVKQLSGLLPICSYCKRIRSDQDYWEQVDSYVAHHSDVKFSHGICPSCFEAVRADFERGPV